MKRRLVHVGNGHRPFLTNINGMTGGHSLRGMLNDRVDIVASCPLQGGGLGVGVGLRIGNGRCPFRTNKKGTASVRFVQIEGVNGI